MRRIVMMAVMALSVMACGKEDDTTRQALVDDKLIQSYLEDNGEEVTKDASGLYYQIIEKGHTEFPAEASLNISYEGKLLDGTTFDAGTVSGPLEWFIEGWQIQIPKLNIGGEAILYVPSRLGYGNSYAGSIPPNTVLIFKIKVDSQN